MIDIYLSKYISLVNEKEKNVCLFKVTHTSQNRTKWEHPGHQLGCYYTGVVDGDPKSIVSVSLCHGMVSFVFILFLFLNFFNSYSDSLLWIFTHSPKILDGLLITGIKN